MTEVEDWPEGWGRWCGGGGRRVEGWSSLVYKLFYFDFWGLSSGGAQIGNGD